MARRNTGENESGAARKGAPASKILFRSVGSLLAVIRISGNAAS